MRGSRLTTLSVCLGLLGVSPSLLHGEALEPAMQVAAPIVNGVLTAAHPSTGALFDLLNGTLCSGVLIGCETLLTAAHCVCDTDGADCQEPDAPNPTDYLVFFQHAGFFPVASVAVNPGYDAVTAEADVAIVKLATPVTGIVPSTIDTAGPPAFGTPAEIVGFGRIGGDPFVDGTHGLKRVGHVTTASCDPVASDTTAVCWSFSEPLGPPGEDSNSCEGDSGGPLFADLGSGPVVAGLTSFGASETCLAPDFSVDTSVAAYRSWVTAAAGADLGSAACGSIPPVGQPATTVHPYSGILDGSNRDATYAFGVGPGTQELRVALNGIFQGNADLYLKLGSLPTPTDYTCASTNADSFEYCQVLSPAAGTWYVLARGVSGLPVYQLTATTFGGDAAFCGNNLREPGEVCDGTDAADCFAGCDTQCACVTCPEGDVEFNEMLFARRFVLSAELHNGSGRYNGIDPRRDGLTLGITDGAGQQLHLAVPARDPGWGRRVRSGFFRWRGRLPGIRQIVLRDRTQKTGSWRLTVHGRDVDGAAALAYTGLTFILTAGEKCAVKRFPSMWRPGS